MESSSDLDTNSVTNHSVNLSGLTANTLYHYRVSSRDAAGNLITSADLTFTTAMAPDVTAPVLSSIATSSLTYNGTVIGWTTNEASDTQVVYGTTSAYGSSTTLNSTLVTNHSVNLSGLTANTLYHYRVSSRDAAGNLITSADLTFTTAMAPDVTAPVLSSIATSSLTYNGTVIGWTTNEASDTQVVYGTTSAYGSSTTLNSTLVTNHSVNLSGLTANTLYHYRVSSRDAAGNLITSADLTFTTAMAPDVTAPVLSSIATSSLTYNGTVIGWTTNEASDTQVVYGTTSAYGSSTTLNSI